MKFKASSLIDIDSIKVDRANRQRRTLAEIDEMAASLKRIGQIQPIVISDDLKLIAGERRLTAAKSLGWKKIEAITKSALSPEEQEIIELEENIRRIDLSWEDRIRATSRIANALAKLEPGITQASIAERLGLYQSDVSAQLTVAEALEGDEAETLRQLPSWRSAYNYITRQVSREADAALDALLSPRPAVAVLMEQSARSEDQPEPDVPLVPASKPHIVCGDAIAFMRSHVGERYNLIHCDFPYGINHDRSEQGNTQAHGDYADTKETFFELLNSLLEHRDNFIAASAHIVFWFSMNYYGQVKTAFEDHGFVVNPTPLIWYKSDNVGIIPDSQRSPRQIYETAFLISRGDRKIVKVAANVSSYPGNKSEMIHVSEKPQKMLEAFFKMLVDSSTSIFDPTCGSGSALRAAWVCGARQLLGYELNQEYATLAQTKLSLTMRTEE